MSEVKQVGIWIEAIDKSTHESNKIEEKKKKRQQISTQILNMIQKSYSHQYQIDMNPTKWDHPNKLKTRKTTKSWKKILKARREAVRYELN